MPTNKRESLIFTFVMCFCMVFGMSIYNVARTQGGAPLDVLAAAWMGFPFAYVFAMCSDWFVAGPIAKGAAFKLFVKPGMPPYVITLIVSCCMVVPMVIIMSLFGCFEAAVHMPGGISAMLPNLPITWLQNIGWNFLGALPLNIIAAGPIARTVFRRAFPIGTVLQEPIEAEGHAERHCEPESRAKPAAC